MLQETEVELVHKVGLYLCFLSGLVWLWCLVLLTWVLSPFQPGSYCCLPLVRTILAASATSTFLTSTVFGEVARSQFHGEDPRKWRPEDGGWQYHIVSTVSEWLMVLSLDLAVLTLAPDFTKLEFEEPKIIVNLEQIGFLNVGAEDEYQSNSMVV